MGRAEAVQCATSGAVGATVTGGPTTYTLDPAVNFAFLEQCTVTLQAAFQLAARIAREKRHAQPLLDTPESVAELLRDENAAYQHEQFQVLLLNTRRRLIQVEKLSQGTLDAARGKREI